MGYDYDENDGQQSVIQDIGDVARNTKDAYKLTDKAVHKIEDLKNRHAEAGKNADTPKGQDISAQNPQGQNATPQGQSIGSQPPTSPSTAPQGPPVNAGSTVGSGATATGSTASGATTSSATASSVGGATASSVGGATASSVGGATATGTSATATGIGATATGAGLASGIGTMGIGTIVTIAIAGTVAIGTAGITAVKKINKEMDEIVDRKPGKGIGGFAGLLIVLIGVLLFSSIVLFTPSAIFAGLVKDIKDGVTTYFVSYTDKADFFCELFDEEEYDIELHREINSQIGVDAQNAEVYKAIIDKAIEKSFSYYMWNVLLEPDKVLLTIFDKLGFSRYSSDATITYYLNQPYPYCLIKSDGSYYTIGDYLNGSIPEEDLNNDLNYAEIIAVYCQNPENAYTSISYSDFYDTMVQEYNSNFLYELELSDIEQWFYMDADGAMILVENEDQAKEGHEEAQKILEERKKAEEEAEESEETEETEDTDAEEEAEGDTEETEEDEEEDLEWGYLFDVTVMPYGLNELYHIAGVDMYEINYATLSISNYDMLNENEKWLRAYLGSRVDLGPSFAKERTYRSVAYNYYVEQGIIPTGRSLLQYLQNTVTSNFITGLLPEYNGGSYEDYSKIEIVYNTEGACVINMPCYINQGNYKQSRGDGTSTVAGSGCIDCCYAMCAMYYNGYTDASVYIPSISKSSNNGGYVIGQSFDGGTFSADNNMVVYRTNTTRLSDNDISLIIANLSQGYPVIISIIGYWQATDGRVIHQSPNSHFITIIGYDESGFVVYDPGSRETTTHGIPFDALGNVTWSSYRLTRPANANFTPTWNSHPDNPF